MLLLLLCCVFDNDERIAFIDFKANKRVKKKSHQTEAVNDIDR